MKRKFLYSILSFVFCEIFFSLNVSAQSDTLQDTVIITPDIDYSTDAVSEEVSMDTATESDSESETSNDSLISNFRLIPNDTIQLLNKDKGFYYKNYFDSLLRATQKIKKNEPVKIKPVDDSFFSLLFKLIIWVGAISVFAFLVYKLFISNSSLFTRNRKNSNGEKIIVDNENPENPASLIDLAVSEGNFRLAVRYLYLQTLINLAEKKYLQTGTEKTNYQYVNELRNQPFANEFASLTLKYEYVWYGEYPLEQNMFQQIQSEFKNFNKQFGR